MKLLWSRALISAFFIFTAVAGCGGGPGKDIEDATKPTEPAGASACTPESASPGQKITCEVGEDFNEDCTVFFGQSLPLEAGETATLNTYVLDKEAGAITLIVPSVVFSSLDITSCCTGVCDERTPIAEDFPILPTSSLPPSLPPSTPAPPDDEETPPAPECSTNTDCTGGKICTGGACVNPLPPDECTKDDDGDAVKNCEDACSGTPSGESVNSSGCSPSQLPPPKCPTDFTCTGGQVCENGSCVNPPPLTATVNVTKMDGTRLGLRKITWNVQGGGGELDELFIYSGGFYRAPNENTCGTIDDTFYSSNGKRRLLVHSNGSDLQEGTGNYDQWKGFLENASKCANPSDCNGEVSPQPCQGGWWCLFTPSPPPLCRVNLKTKDGQQFVRSGAFYTRVLAGDPKVPEKNVKFKLYAKTKTNETKTAESGFVDVPQADFTSAQVSAPSKKAVLLFAAAYENAIVEVPVPSGCTKLNGDYDKNLGTGEFEAECPFKDINTSVIGIGFFSNSASKNYKVFISEPFVSLEENGGTCPKKETCEGTIGLKATVGRSFTVKEGSKTVLGDGFLGAPTTAGISKVSLYSNASLYVKIKEMPITPSNNVATAQFTDVSRDYDHYKWQARVYFGGKTYESSWVNRPYPKPTFKMSNQKHGGQWAAYWDTCGGEDWGAYWACECDNVEGALILSGSVEYEAQYIGKVVSNCPFMQISQPLPGLYGVQKLTASFTNYSFGNSCGTVICEFKATDYQNKQHPNVPVFEWKFAGSCDENNGKDSVFACPGTTIKPPW